MIPFWLGAGYHMFQESQRGKRSTLDELDDIAREFDEACKPIMDECARLVEEEARKQGVNQTTTQEDFPEIDLTFPEDW